MVEEKEVDEDDKDDANTQEKDNDRDKSEPFSVVDEGGPDTESEPDTPRSTEENLRKADTHYPRVKSPSPKGSPRGSPRKLSVEESRDGANGQEQEAAAENSGRRSPAGSQDDDYDDEDEAFGEMTDDQRQAMKELREMKLDLAYTGI